MPKRIPNPNSDNAQWGTILNAHLAQTKNPVNGAFNSFDTFSERPAASSFTKDDAGKMYLFTQTGNWHELYLNTGTSNLDWKVQNNNNNSYANVKDYGAYGDGMNDDTKAIQDCLTRFKKIYFPTGVYCSKATVRIPSDRTLLGDGGMLSEIRNIDTIENHFIISYYGTDSYGILYTGATDITIDSLYLNGNRSRISNEAMKGSTFDFGNYDTTKEPRQNNISIKNCVIAGNGFNNIGSENSHYVLIDGCRFINGRDSGIAATTGCSNWTVVNCTFDDSIIFPISFSNNGVPQKIYDNVEQARNIIISNNRIKVGGNIDLKKNAVKGIGIELDACRNVIVSNNIITLTSKSGYGIRIVPSGTPDIYDCNDINIIGNTIINQSSGSTVGIELYNTYLDNEPKHIKISNNIIRNEITSNHTGIGVYNLNRVIIENNIIKSAGSLLQGILLNVFVAGDVIFNVDVTGNDISGASLAGVQCSGTTKTTPKVNFINNRVYNNASNLGFNSGWEFQTGNNYAPSKNYLDPGAIIHGDLRFYTNHPTNGTWLLNEIVYNAAPVISSLGVTNYIGWVCISGGNPGIWKGFGAISM
jgi:hypothetical protein